MGQTIKITEGQTLKMVSKIVETASNGNIKFNVEKDVLNETAKPKKQRIVKITEAEYKKMIHKLAEEQLEQAVNEEDTIEEEFKFDFGVDLSKYM